MTAGAVQVDRPGSWDGLNVEGRRKKMLNLFQSATNKVVHHFSISTDHRALSPPRRQRPFATFTIIIIHIDSSPFPRLLDCSRPPRTDCVAARHPRLQYLTPLTLLAVADTLHSTPPLTLPPPEALCSRWQQSLLILPPHKLPSRSVAQQELSSTNAPPTPSSPSTACPGCLAPSRTATPRPATARDAVKLEGTQSPASRSSRSASDGSDTTKVAFHDLGGYGDALDEKPAMTERWRSMNPLNLLSNGSGFFYQRLPGDSPPGASPFSLQPLKNYRWPSPRRTTERLFPARFSPSRLLWTVVAALVLLFLLLGGYEHRKIQTQQAADNKPEPFFWQHYPRLNGFYNGIRTLVPYSEFVPENGYNKSRPLDLIPPQEASKLPKMPPLNPVPFDPYPKYDSKEYTAKHHKVEKCYLDEDEKVAAPDVYVYPGVPQNMSEPHFGSYKELGLEEKVCFDRFGRFGPYGYGYTTEQGGLGPGNKSENVGSEKVFYQTGIINYTNIDWGTLQDACYEKNRIRFEGSSNKKLQKVKRHAYVLRIWEDFYFNEHQMFSLRAMINELSLKSGGEYDVHFLLHVKNTSIPIWANSEVYAQFVRDNMPQEFWNMTTLWSEAQMQNYYPEPWGETFANVAGSGIHGVYRSAHFAIQWFAQQHPDYDFYWNWEMDLRYTGHYYEFNTRIGDWARAQPRKGLWERNERYYIPQLHGSWQNFTDMVERETKESGQTPVWGPVSFDNSGLLTPPDSSTPPRKYEDDKYEWGVGEDADFISFNPIFDPQRTNWVFRDDITGYDMAKPKPPRRCAIITVARLSKRLLNIMHEETWKARHSMFPEMWPPSVALHHGLKAVYAPHPVYFDRDWELEYMDAVFNHPKEEWESPFGWGEHNLLGSSFYYNSGFSGALWRRWLGQAENNEGGKKSEESTTGRMCLRSTLHHPIKHELGSMD